MRNPAFCICEIKGADQLRDSFVDAQYHSICLNQTFFPRTRAFAFRCATKATNLCMEDWYIYLEIFPNKMSVCFVLIVV